jgi:NAD(P)-dependent dehydrogenase (short-subunit alcohol dehydrogenase family)
MTGIRVLVTGATAGIGRAAAEEFGRHGAEIFVHERDAPAATSRRRMVTG